MMGTDKYHELKTWRGPFQAIWDGDKRFEFRKNDRGFELYDRLRLREWDPSGKTSPTLLGCRGDYTGREVIAEVTYLLTGGFGIPEGYVVMSIQLLQRKENPNE